MSEYITVTVGATKGSTPREVGASMIIGPESQDGTIGGGALEYEATRLARDMLIAGQMQMRRTFPLGPDLGQCCGGAVTLDFIAGGHSAKPVEPPFWIWGAGHVGRAVVHALHPLQDRTITWVDTGVERFPKDLPPLVDPLVVAIQPQAVTFAPQDADHLILTYSHDIDLALCDALLRHGFGSAGLIGSATKWARFKKRLSLMGHKNAEIERITCPIGEPSLGKHPAALAVGVVAQLLIRPKGDRG
jgi:xanthine dehydrogenase accessory factor